MPKQKMKPKKKVRPRSDRNVRQSGYYWVRLYGSIHEPQIGKWYENLKYFKVIGESCELPEYAFSYISPTP